MRNSVGTRRSRVPAQQRRPALLAGWTAWLGAAALPAFVLALLLAAPQAAPADSATLTGQACYRYGEDESLDSARQMAQELAVRDALEHFPMFTESGAAIVSDDLRNEIAHAIGKNLLKDVQVTQSKENRFARVVCRHITATVDPLQVKYEVAAYMIHNRNPPPPPPPPALPENRIARVVAMREVDSSDEFVQYRADLGLPVRPADQQRCTNGCVVYRAICKEYSEPWVARATWRDARGQPVETHEFQKMCHNPGDIVNLTVTMPQHPYTYSVVFPDG